ncbi:MAG: hypothetical protein F4X44_08200 [Gammaproteobacteria bacterium]|nr:hypothetical protein [Gammaproteobacteria bacterium]MYD80578.1 hypothetical protein [Gammaproteobacteria bacterium]
MFFGRVLHKGELEDGQLTPALIGVKFGVVKFWKGKSESDTDDLEKSERLPSMEVSTPAHTTYCGYPFKIGETYLVFAGSSRVRIKEDDKTHPKLLITTWCSANEKLDDSLGAKDLVMQLEALKSKDQQESKDENDNRLDDTSESDAPT